MRMRVVSSPLSLCVCVCVCIESASSFLPRAAHGAARHAREREVVLLLLLLLRCGRPMCVRDVIEHTQRINENVLRRNTREKRERKERKKKREREVFYSTHKETTPNTTTI